MSQKLVDQLKKKNEQLEEEVKTCRELYHNLMDERCLETGDSRRAFMLKAQIFQLERQCMLLSQAQSSRALILNETENQLKALIVDFQDIMSQENPGPNITLSRSKLMVLIGTLQKLKNSLYRQSNLESSDQLRIPSLMDRSIYVNKKKTVTLLDVCCGNTDHLNLKHISQLETKLCNLFKQLCVLQSMIRLSVPQENLSNSADVDVRDLKLPPPEKQFLSHSLKHLQNCTKHCLEELSDCCDELTALSLLHPGAPWSVLKKTDVFSAISADKVGKTLSPGLQRKPEVIACLRSVCKAHNYLMHINTLQLNAAREQIAYFEQIHKHQLKYMSSLYSGIKQGYKECEQNIVETVRDPVISILDCWFRLKSSQSNKNLKEFLDCFKHFEEELKKLSGLKSSMEVDSGDAESDSLLYNFEENMDSVLHKIESEHLRRIALAEKKFLDYRSLHEDDVRECLQSYQMA